MSETNKNKQGQKRRISILAIASIILGVSILVIWLCKAPKVHAIGGYGPSLPASIHVVFVILPIIGLFLGIVATVKIRKNKTRLRGSVPATLGILINALFVFITIYGVWAEYKYREKCIIWSQFNIKSLGKAMKLYSGYDDNYPTADKWCDLLIEHADVAPSQFICRGSDVVEGESSYAFNENLAGKKMSEVPLDVVVVFETNFGKTPVGRDGCIGDRDYNKALVISHPDREVYKLRWNQVGGPEILTVENHKGKGCNILFNDTHVEFVKTEDLGRLKWKIEETKNE